MTYQKDWLTIVNRALSRVGQDQLTSLEEGTATANLANAQLRGAIQDVAGLYPWRCMTKRKELAPDTTAPAFGYDYSYPLPPNFARLIKVFTENDEKWVREAGAILTDSEKLYIIYIELPDSTDNLIPSIQQLITIRMAYNIVVSTTTNTTLANILGNEYASALINAKMDDPAGEEDITEFNGWVDRR